MNASEFVTRLSGTAPSLEALYEHDYSEKQAASYIACYNCIARKEPLGIQVNGDPVLELFNFWDLSRVEIGAMVFRSQATLKKDLYEIGTLEGDRLVYRLEIGDFVLLDWQDLDNVLYRIAQDSDSFLEGLLLIAECLSKNSIEEINLDDDAEAGEHYVARCAASFGGVDSESFCRLLLGV